jgi:hypothetical protein
MARMAYNAQLLYEEGKWLALKDISVRLKQTFRSSYKEEPGTFEKIGNFLNRPEYKFQSHHCNTGTEYLVVETIANS